jgi:uncharacterized membrane protein
MMDSAGMPSPTATHEKDPPIERTRMLPRAAIFGLLIAAYSLLAHITTTRSGHGTAAALLAIAPVAALALLLAWRSLRWAGVLLWLIAAAVLAVYWGTLKAHFVWVYLLQQLGLYGFLGMTFGRTLAHGSVPLCTQMALQVHGALPEAAVRYTRQVTVAWTVFFVLIATTLLGLFFFAPLSTWSAFANFGAPLAIALMFGVENRLRYRALPNMPHSGLIATLKASAAVGLGGAKASHER